MWIRNLEVILELGYLLIKQLNDSLFFCYVLEVCFI